jgi:hypothetical protein
MTPPRRDKPKAHLDASVVPVERALLARADVIASDIGTGALAGLIRQRARCHGVTDGSADALADALALVLAAEFRALAEELHYW